MTRKTIARNSGGSGRVNVSGPEFGVFEAEIGDSVGVDVADTREVVHALIDSKDADRFLAVTPR